MATFTLTIECNSKEFWRYNVIVSAVTNLDNGQATFLKHVDEVAPVCSNLSELPKSYCRPVKSVLEFESGEHITLYIYVIPHTMPNERLIANISRPELHVVLKCASETLYNRRHCISPWSGDNIQIVI